MRLRAAAAPTGFAGNINFRWAYGWVSAFDNLLKVQAGRIQGNQLDTLDPITDGDTLFDAHGIQLWITPIDMVTFVVGAYAKEGLSAGTILEDDALTGYLGLGVYLGVADILAQMSSAREDLNAYLSVGVSAIQNVPIELTLTVNDISNFSDSGVLGIFPHVGINVIENLGINLAGAIWLPQASGADTAFRGWFWLTYALGNIIPRLDVNYISGGVFNAGGGLYKNSIVGDPNFNTDYALLTVSPSVLMRVAPNMHFELGYLLGADMSKNDVAAMGGKNKGVNNAAFMDVRVSF